MARPADTDLIRCRPHVGYVWMPLFFAAMGGISLSLYWLFPGPRGVMQALIVGILGLPWLVLAGYLGVWLARAGVTADVSGLRWRGIGRWREAQWEEVTDYYDTPPRRNGSAPAAPRTVVETAVGKLFLNSELTHREAIRRRIAQRATRARARGWGTLGARPEDDWPREFDYDTADNRWAPRIFAASSLLLVAFMGWTLTGVGRLAAEIGWPLALGASGVFSLVMLSLVALMQIAAPARTRRRSGERIRVDREGITFTAPDQAIAARWSEVEDYFLAPQPGRISGLSRYEVVTSRGSFDFDGRIRDASILAEAIRRFAGRARAAGWRSREDTENLGGEAARWTGGSPGCGLRVYHYRTRTNRALLGFFGALAAAPLVPILLERLGLQSIQDRALLYGIAALLVILFAWAAWRYASASIRTDETGITQRGPGGDRAIPWCELQDFYTSGEPPWTFANLVGAQARIRFWTGIADAEELQDEIARRARKG